MDVANGDPENTITNSNNDEGKDKSNPLLPSSAPQSPSPSPSPLPSPNPDAENDQIAEYSSTIDPSHVIHLIRQLLPVKVAAPGSEEDRPKEECRGHAEKTEGDPASDGVVKKCAHEEIHILDPQAKDFEAKDYNGSEDLNGREEDEAANEGGEKNEGVGSPKGGGDVAKSDSCGICEQEELREEAGCVLWDLAANESQAEFLVDNRILEVLLAILQLSQSDRMREICLGILGNLACHSKPVKVLVNFEGLVQTIIQQLQFEDPPSLCETCRLLSAGLHSDAASAWITALQQEETLDRIMWIVANTMNSQLREKSTELLLAIVDSKQEAFCALLPILLRMGLPELLTDLIESEVTAISEGTSTCGDAVLDIVLQIAEALSLSDEFATRLTSNQKLFSLACQVIRLSHKDEIGPSGITGTVLVANLLTEKNSFIGDFLQDGTMVTHLLGLLPTVSEDSGARNALWSILQRLCQHLQAVESEMPSDEAANLMAALADGSNLLMDDLDDHREDDEQEDEERALAAAPTCGRQAKLATIVKVVQVMEIWLASVPEAESGGEEVTCSVQAACQLLGNLSASPDSVMHDQILRR